MTGQAIGLFVAAAVVGIALGYGFSLLLNPVRSKASRRRVRESDAVERVESHGGRVTIL